MKHATLIFLLLIANFCFAQDKETQAQATYMAAEDAYNSSNFQKAYDKLVATENILGKSNAKIEYLKVKSLVELKKYSEAKTELSKYFDVASGSKGSEKYQEMMMLYGKIDDMEAEAIAKTKADNETQNKINILVAEIDSIYKEAVLKSNNPRTLKVDSTSFQGNKLTFHYSGRWKDNYLQCKYGVTNYVDLNKLEDIGVSYSKNYRGLPTIIIRYVGQSEPQYLTPDAKEKYNPLLIKKIKELMVLVNINK